MEQQFVIRRADASDVDGIMEIMTEAKATAEHPDWFVDGDRACVESCLDQHGFTLVAEAADGELAAFFIVAFPEREENLGADLGFAEPELALVAHMDSAAVKSKFRGHHLQSRMVTEAERMLWQYPHCHLMCTIHPDNHASLHTMQRHGYVVVATKPKYGGLLRHILYKKKEKPTVLVSACLMGVHCRYNGEGVVDEAVMALSERANLVPVCPEIMGGLATPRDPAERRDGRVMTIHGADVTAAYERGAAETLALAQRYGCTLAVLKERSPSCGCGRIYDGTHTRTLTDGDGVTAALLKAHGIRVVGESEAKKMLLIQRNAK